MYAIQFTPEELKLMRERLTLKLLMAKQETVHMPAKDKETCEGIIKKIDEALEV